MESEEFLLLPVNQLVEIISSDELNVRNEEQVYSAVMSWVKYNISERRHHLLQVGDTRCCCGAFHFCLLCPATYDGTRFPSKPSFNEPVTVRVFLYGGRIQWEWRLSRIANTGLSPHLAPMLEVHRSPIGAV